uniref:Rhodanese domain-containing protein n=1 Tax=Alexandrium monilatum TaxID=311494 RepID=A0A7S4VZ89_9DINO|mmetsp:Transcript_98947/g.308591  ORF Transcript_98947/g.308591 Transcript_98947/m.308591 type:complete len:529 (+) Transcript_98947:138-1724(+)
MSGFAFDFDELDQKLPDARRVRVWAVSDVHTDMKQNMVWIANLSTTAHTDDVLVLAGDVSNKVEEVEATLTACKQRFSRVFFVPGNHDLWVGRGKRGSPPPEDSLGRLRRLQGLCRALGVETAPGKVPGVSGGLLVVPLLSWHHPQWDTEPEIEGWGGVRAPEQVVSDFALTAWPEPLSILDGSVAHAVDAVNDEVFDEAELVRNRRSYASVLTFSHFLPRLELNPEKRYLTAPMLAKAVGSSYLKDRVERLRPDMHVFGHTHFGLDMVVDGIRYLQAPLAYPTERELRATTVALGGFPALDPRPCLVWDSVSGWAPAYRGAWSEYYARYGRRPEVTTVLPQYVATSLTPHSETCRVGWIRGRAPAWLFGPRAHREAEALMAVREVRRLVAKQHELPESVQPQSIEVSDCQKLHMEGKCRILDIRRDADTPANGMRITGSVAMPHPSLTETFPSRPDDELIEFCERLMDHEGPLVIVGLAAACSDCVEAALLLAWLLRLRPRDLRILRGGLRAWVSQGGAVSPALQGH